MVKVKTNPSTIGLNEVRMKFEFYSDKLNAVAGMNSGHNEQLF